jgi:hypothetical protein
MAVCELAAVRGLRVPPLGRLLEIPLGMDWWADLSTDCTGNGAENTLSSYGLRLRHGGSSVHLGPFTPSSVDPSGDLERRVRVAIEIARVASETGSAEDLLFDTVRSMASTTIPDLLHLCPDPSLWRLARAARLMRGLL